MNLFTYLVRQRRWSRGYFGRDADPIENLNAILNVITLPVHGGKPLTLNEWCETAALALDGALRAGHSPEEICAELRRIQATAISQYPVEGVTA